jgi:hypothetical protein
MPPSTTFPTSSTLLPNSSHATNLSHPPSTETVFPHQSQF